MAHRRIGDRRSPTRLRAQQGARWASAHRILDPSPELKIAKEVGVGRRPKHPTWVAQSRPAAWTNVRNLERDEGPVWRKAGVRNSGEGEDPRRLRLLRTRAAVDGAARGRCALNRERSRPSSGELRCHGLAAGYMRSITHVLVALSLLVVLVAAAWATTRPGDPSLFPAQPGTPRLVVFLSHNAYHAELGLPTAFIRRQGGAAAAALDDLPPSPWVLIGWGDSRFYRTSGWSLARFRDGLHALWPNNPSVIRLTPLDREPDLAFKRGVLRVELSEPGAERLLERLDHSFRTVRGRPVRVPALQAGDPAAYFESVERFSIARMCNDWVGAVLNAAGLPTTPILDLAPQGLVWDVQLRTGAMAGSAGLSGRAPVLSWRGHRRGLG